MPVIPNKYDDPQFVELRKNQDDPLVMYLIVREILNMGVGKTAAQCAHGAQMIAMKIQEYQDALKTYPQAKMEAYNRGDTKFYEDLNNAQEKLSKYTLPYLEWCRQSFRKVVLHASDNEWKKIKESTEFDCMVVIDAGLTGQIEPGTETCIAMFPILKSKAPKVIKRLQVLK